MMGVDALFDIENGVLSRSGWGTVLTWPSSLLKLDFIYRSEKRLRSLAVRFRIQTAFRAWVLLVPATYSDSWWHHTVTLR